MKPKLAKLEGRDHYVVPVVMIVEGVLVGSNGPLLYLRNDMQATARDWDGKPTVVYHPAQYGYGTANSPQVFDTQRVGTVFNSRVVGPRLLADLWVDVLRVAAVDNRVKLAIESGKKIEVSTGLYSDVEQRAGTFNGKQYNGVARDYRPDHLAILPDQVGACSLSDGCGALVSA